MREKERKGEGGGGIHLLWELEIACGREEHTGPQLGVHDNETAAQSIAVFKLCAPELVRPDASFPSDSMVRERELEREIERAGEEGEIFNSVGLRERHHLWERGTYRATTWCTRQ